MVPRSRRGLTSQRRAAAPSLAHKLHFVAAPVARASRLAVCGMLGARPSPMSKHCCSIPDLSSPSRTSRSRTSCRRMS